MTIEKTMPWLRIEAADEARCDSIARFAQVDPDWKIAKKEMNDAEEALLDAQSAARERFPETAYDEETSQSLNRLTHDYEQKCAKYRKLNSRRKSIHDEVGKLTERLLNMISEARQPGIFDGGQDLGPDGWKKLRLRDLTGGPDPKADIEKQVWTAAELETHGYDTIDQFLKGRGRLIPALVDDGEIASGTLAKVDLAVYRFLERRNLLDRWPEGIEPPSGEQMIIMQAYETPEEAEKPKAKSKPEPEAEKPKGADAGSPMTVKLPEAKFWYGSNKLECEACSMRSVMLMRPWQRIAEDKGVELDLTDAEHNAFEEFMGPTPYEAIRKLAAINYGDEELPKLPIDETEFGSMLGLWFAIAADMGKIRGTDLDELTQFLFTDIIEKGSENVRRFAKWCGDFGAMLCSHRDSEHYNADHAKPAGPKPVTKKRTSKKTKKKTASRSRAK